MIADGKGWECSVDAWDSGKLFIHGVKGLLAVSDKATGGKLYTFKSKDHAILLKRYKMAHKLNKKRWKVFSRFSLQDIARNSHKHIVTKH